MFKADNSIHAFVSSAPMLLSETLASSAAGDVVILDKNGAAITTGLIANGTLIQVVQKDADGNARMSPLVEFRGATGSTPVTRIEQQTDVTGIVPVANTRYTLRLNFKHNVELFSQQSDLHFFEYTTGDTVVASEVKANFVLQINLAEGVNKKVVASSVSDSAFKIVGSPQTWSLGLHADTMVSFDTTLVGFGAGTAVATGVGSAASPVVGSGSGKQVAELEWFAVGSAGAPYRNNAMPNNGDLISLNAVSTDTYDMASLDCIIPGPSHAVAGSGVGRCQIIIAIKSNATVYAALDTALGLTTVFAD